MVVQHWRKQQLQELSSGIAAAYIKGRSQGRKVCRELQLSKHCGKLNWGGMNKIKHASNFCFPSRAGCRFRNIISAINRGLHRKIWQ